MVKSGLETRASVTFDNGRIDMTLNEHMRDCLKLAEAGHGNAQVFYRHGASGDCGPVGSLHVTDETDDCGPFDLEPGEQYISMYIGN